MNATMISRTRTSPRPEPSRAHATCAWCSQNFDTLVQLLDHVDAGHLDPGHRDLGHLGPAQASVAPAHRIAA